MAKKNGKGSLAGGLTPENRLAIRQADFVRVVTPRVKKAVKAISLVSNCASSNYSFTAEQAGRIIIALHTAVDVVEVSFSKKTQATAEFQL